MFSHAKYSAPNTQMQGNSDAWTRLASRAMRVVMARKDSSYASLAAELLRLGVHESARSVEGKIQRGSFRFSFFLQSLVAVGAEYPEQWSSALAQESTWEARSTAVFRAELTLQPWIDWLELSHRLGLIGVGLSAESLETQVQDGTPSAALFFQCATVCRFDGLERFLDRADLTDAAYRARPEVRP